MALSGSRRVPTIELFGQCAEKLCEIRIDRFAILPTHLEGVSQTEFKLASNLEPVRLLHSA
jgi:hypothetical protein